MRGIVYLLACTARGRGRWVAVAVAIHGASWGRGRGCTWGNGIYTLDNKQHTGVHMRQCLKGILFG